MDDSFHDDSDYGTRVSVTEPRSVTSVSISSSASSEAKVR